MLGSKTHLDWLHEALVPLVLLLLFTCLWSGSVHFLLSNGWGDFQEALFGAILWLPPILFSGVIIIVPLWIKKIEIRWKYYYFSLLFVGTPVMIAAIWGMSAILFLLEQTGVNQNQSMNALFYLVLPIIVALLVSGFIATFMNLWENEAQRIRRLQLGLCSHCQYDVRYTLQDGQTSCPECGSAITEGG